jgi:hypothetical protein
MSGGSSSVDYDLITRIARKTTLTPTGCMEAKPGYRNLSGYMQMKVGGVTKQIHRQMYLAHGFTIPDGHDLDHLCRNRACVNPMHLEPVTRSVNLRRGDTGRHRGRRTHCGNGHEYAVVGYTVERKADGYTTRVCRECRNAPRRKGGHRYKYVRRNER